MTTPDSTAWDLLEAAAAGDPEEREAFARRYGPFLRDWLAARWRNSSLLSQVEDAVHEVFLECLKPNGVLLAALREEVTSFRAFLTGVVRNIAMRHERRLTSARRIVPVADVDPDQQPGGESSVSRPLDREWARAIVHEAGSRMRERAQRLGESARLRVAILNLRFQEDLGIAEVAERLGKPAAMVHHQYAKARREFRAALEQVLRERSPGKQSDLLATCKLLMSLLR